MKIKIVLNWVKVIMFKLILLYSVPSQIKGSNHTLTVTIKTDQLNSMDNDPYNCLTDLNIILYKIKTEIHNNISKIVIIRNLGSKFLLKNYETSVYS